MSMQFKKRNAFTIVELIIVIVVIAVISAAVITVYFTVVENAKRSKDIQTARQMQTAVTVGMPSEGANEVEIVKILFKSGFAPDDLFASAEDNVFAWCRSEGTIVLYTEAGDVLFPAYLDGRYSRDEMSSVFIPLYNALSVVEAEEDAPSEESSSKEAVEPFAETEEGSSSAEESTTEEKTEPLPETTEETTTVAPETTEETTTIVPETTEETTTTAPETTEEETTTVAPETTEPADDKVILIRSDDEFRKAVNNAELNSVLTLMADVMCHGVTLDREITVDLNGHTLTVAVWAQEIYTRSTILIKNGNIIIEGFDEERYTGINILSGALVLNTVHIDAIAVNVFGMSANTKLTIDDSIIDSDGCVIVAPEDVSDVKMRTVEMHSRETAISIQNSNYFYAEQCNIYAPLAIDAGGGSVELRNTNAYLEDGSGGVMRFGGGTELLVEMQSVSAARTELTAPVEGIVDIHFDNSTATEFFFDKENTPLGTIFLNYLDVLEPW